MQFCGFNEDYVRRLAAGDAPIAEHFAAYFSELLNIKLRGRVRSRDAVEEARQETFVRVLQALRNGGLEHPERLGSFVNSVCNNVLFEKYRNDGRYTQITDGAEDPPDSRIDLDAPLIDQERRRLVERVLAKLGTRDRRLLRMVFIEEVDKVEACRRLGVSDGYFRVLLHRAKSRFGEELARRAGPAAERVVWWSPVKRNRYPVHNTVRYSDGT